MVYCVILIKPYENKKPWYGSVQQKRLQKNFAKFSETQLFPFPFLKTVAYWDTENVEPRYPWTPVAPRSLGTLGTLEWSTFTVTAMSI